MARPKKNIKGGSTGVIDTSALLNKLVAIRKEAQETDAALNAIGNRKHEISDVVEYMKLANVLKDVREQIAALNDTDINVKEYRDLSNLLSSMGKSADDVVDVMRELAGFKIDNVVDENAAKTQLKNLAQRAQQAFKGTPLQFELDADVFDEKDIKVQFQRVISAVNPCLKQLSAMMADVGWDKLVSNTATEKTKKQIKKGSEAIVAQLDKDIEALQKRRTKYSAILNDFGNVRPRKLVKGKETEQLDDLFAELSDARSNTPDVIDPRKQKAVGAAVQYFKKGQELKRTYDAAMQDSTSVEATYFKENQQMYEHDIQLFEEWCSEKVSLLAGLQNNIKLQIGKIDSEIEQANAEKAKHYEQVTIEPTQSVEITNTAKKAIEDTNKKLSTTISAIFNNIIPQIAAEGEGVGNTLYTTIASIFETLRQAGIDVSVDNPVSKQIATPTASKDEKNAIIHHNNNANRLNALAKELRPVYDEFTTMSAEDVATDFGAKVKEHIFQIVNILQESGFAIGADNGYIETLQEQIQQIQKRMMSCMKNINPLQVVYRLRRL